MTKAIDILLQPRLNILDQVKDLSIEQLNSVPPGFKNNIIWNLGHMVAAQQGICYKRAALNAYIDEDFFNRYKPGTKPEEFLDEAEFEKIKGLLTSTLDKLEADLNTDMFANYTGFVTRYGVELTGISDAVAFLPFHEGFHIGTIVALRKLVG